MVTIFTVFSLLDFFLGLEQLGDLGLHQGGPFRRHKLREFSYNPVLLIPSQMRVHRQREDLRSGFFCDGKISPLVPEAGVSILKVQRNRIVTSCANTS